MNKTGFVYVVTNPSWPGWAKVGRTQSPKIRLSGYQVGSPVNDYRMPHAAPCNDVVKGEALALKTLCEALGQGSARGEWVKCSGGLAAEHVLAATLAVNNGEAPRFTEPRTSAAEARTQARTETRNKKAEARAKRRAKRRAASLAKKLGLIAGYEYRAMHAFERMLIELPRPPTLPPLASIPQRNGVIVTVFQASESSASVSSSSR